jgi:putative Holliday junction resolvase
MIRILAVDPGDKRIGLAVSDPSGTIARPLAVVKHVSRNADAETIVQWAEDCEADRILVGLALDSAGQISHQARKALRLVEALRAVTDLQVDTWDESDSTSTALRLGGEKDNMTDARAAAVFLQEYLHVENP